MTTGIDLHLFLDPLVISLGSIVCAAAIALACDFLNAKSRRFLHEQADGNTLEGRRYKNKIRQAHWAAILQNENYNEVTRSGRTDLR